MTTYFDKMKQSVNSLYAKMRKYKGMMALIFSLCLSGLFGLMVNASGGGSTGNVTSDMTTALQTAFGNVQTDVVSVITTALPYALAVMGLILAVTIGIRFFKRVSK